ncbi:hypothetical protein D3C80_1638200 [compost metagenome]
MNRVQADKRAAAFTHFSQHLFQIAKIADAPVIVRTQSIKLHASAPQLFTFEQRLRFIAAFRRDNHPTREALAVLRERQGVVTLRQFCRKSQRFTARGVAVMLVTVFSSQIPAKFSFAFNR